MSILKIEVFGTQKKRYDVFVHWLWFFPRFTRPIRVVHEPSPLELDTPENFIYYPYRIWTMWFIIMSPPPPNPQLKGRGDILFLVRIPSATSLSALYLLNQWVYLYQICTNTLGQGKEVHIFIFWWPWPHFQGHTSTLNVRFWPKTCLHPISWTKW